MGKGLDWSAHRNRKRPGPLVSHAEHQDNKLKAKQLAARVSRGHKSPQAHRHGPVRKLTPEEVADWAEAHGYLVADQKADDDDPPW